MPSIVAVPYPDRGHVLLEINFADVSTATHVCVEATDTATGLTRPLHAYVSYNSDGCMALSCGQAILWDTEIICGNPTIYCATAIDTAGDPITLPADPLVTDTFTRVVVADWGTADTGQAWTNTSGLAADHFVNGTRGIHNTVVTGAVYEDTIPVGTANATVSAQVFIPAAALSQPYEISLEGRRTDANNYYALILSFTPVGTVTGLLIENVAGVQATLATVASGTYTAGTLWNMSLTYWGNQLSAFWHDATLPEPVTPQLTATDSSLTTGSLAGLRARRNAGNTNGTVAFQYDNFRAAGVCDEPEPIEVCTEEVTIACDGCFRLGNPVRPCADIRVCLCADGVDCGNEGGVFFVAMTPDIRASNSGSIEPTNDIYPIPVNRRRMKPTSNLTVVPTSFAARDQLIDLLSTGEPLLFRTTPEFGIGNRYLQIGDVAESYQLADMTAQPRIMNLPNAEVRPPVGPSLGVCGARVVDLCDVYDTWDEMVAAGLTWADLLRGEASTTPSGLATWDDIQADHIDWDALQADETDWSDVLDGD